MPLPIPVGLRNTGMNYVSEKSITFKELMKIKDICRNHPSDHYMLTPSAIHHLGMKINGSTIEVYTPPVPSETCSFVKCVLPKQPKGIGAKIKNIFLNQRFVHQTSLLGIDSVKKFVPKEWYNHSNGIDHPFQKKLKLAKNEAIQWVLIYRNERYKDYKIEN